MAGISLVRELYDVQQAMEAAGAMFVVSLERYIAEAAKFATHVGITLVDGTELLRIMGDGLVVRPSSCPLWQPLHPTCPECGTAMVRRTARHGPHAGPDFGVLDASRVSRDGIDPRRHAGHALIGTA